MIIRNIKFQLLIVSSLLLISLCSCKKKKKEYNEVTFANQINEKINLAFYSSLDDYSNNSIPHLKYTLAANERHMFDAASFKMGSEYYVDWYSNDFKYNNWYNDLFNQEITPYVRIVPISGNNTYYTNPAYLSDNRIVFLNNNQISTTWKAVDYYGYSQQTGYTSIWNSLTENEKLREITIYKNFKASYSYKNANGEPMTRELNFKVHHTPQAYIEFLASSDVSLGHMISGKLPSGIAPDYKSDAKDTVLALLPDAPESYFLMVRQ